MARKTQTNATCSMTQQLPEQTHYTRSSGASRRLTVPFCSRNTCPYLSSAQFPAAMETPEAVTPTNGVSKAMGGRKEERRRTATVLPSAAPRKLAGRITARVCTRQPGVRRRNNKQRHTDAQRTILSRIVRSIHTQTDTQHLRAAMRRTKSAPHIHRSQAARTMPPIHRNDRSDCEIAAPTMAKSEPKSAPAISRPTKHTPGTS